MISRRGLLSSLLALAAAPALHGFAPKQIMYAIAPERYVSVLDFGADPTGQRDSTVALRSAVEAASMLQGGVVYFPTGTYSVRDPVVGWAGVRLIPHSC